jgi:dihydrofolate synthase/folylpolyglutamate synthase
MLQLESTPYRKLHFVLGVVSDKDVSACCETPAEAGKVLFLQADIPRGLDAYLLEK